MRLGVVLRVLSLISLIVSLFMIFPLALAVCDGAAGRLAFLASLAVGLLISLGFFLAGKRGTDYQQLGIHEAIAVVGFSWVIASAVGALPYLFSGAASTYADAFFETMSGFTTTGATILTDIEGLPRGLLLWRSLTHWIGGMGIIVLSLAILPFLGVGGMELYKAEVPGPTPEKLTPRLHETALLLWEVYLALTVAETLLLTLGGMSLFEAVVHSFATIATGGFSTRNASIAAFHSPYIEWVITAFMFASGVNFSLYFLIFARRVRAVLGDEELRWYAAIVAASALAIALCLLRRGFSGVEPALRASFFHVVSLITTTGFVTENYDLWPEFARFLLLILMVVGACAGSTGGGCKVVRFLVLRRQVQAETLRLLHPRATVTARMNGRAIGRDVMDSASAFLVLYLLIMTSATLAVTAFDHPKLDVMSAFSGVVACLSNVGPGLGALGPVENFAWLPAGVKWILSFCMLAGRLELFAVFLLFLPGAWRR